MTSYSDLFLQAMDGDNAFDVPKSGVLVGKILRAEDDGFFVSVGGKSEMYLSMIEAFPPLAIGDEVQVVEISNSNGLPCVSQKKVKQLIAWQDIDKSLREGIPVQAIVRSPISNKEGKPSGYLVSINGVEAFLPLSQVRVFAGESIIDKVLTVLVIKSSRDRVVVSERVLQERNQQANFGKFLETHAIGDKISVEVRNVSDSFALVSMDEVMMFLHITEFDWAYVKTLSGLIKPGDRFDAVILEFDNEKSSVRVSRKQAMENPIQQFIRSAPEGKTVSATVMHFTRNSALLRSDDFIEFILPASEMSWVENNVDQKKILNVGDKVEVKVKEVDSEKNKVIVSLKELHDNPWDTVETEYPINSCHKGKVAFVADFGVFVVFPDGIQGLVRIEDVDWDSDHMDLSARFEKHDPVSVIVLQYNNAQKRLRLGIKQLSKNPILEFAKGHPIGSEVTGEIIRVGKTGVILSLESGLEGFIPASHLNHGESDVDIKEAFKIGSTVTALVHKIGVQQKKIELSIKNLVKKEERKDINRYSKSSESDIPTLGSMFGDILKK